MIVRTEFGFSNIFLHGKKEKKRKYFEQFTAIYYRKNKTEKNSPFKFSATIK